MDTVITLALNRPRARLIVIGEFDAASVVDLESQLDDAVQDGCMSFEVDASGVTFVDMTALGILVRLRNVVEPLGGAVVVVAASAYLRWAATVAGLGDAFGLDRLPDEDPGPPTP